MVGSHKEDKYVFIRNRQDAIEYAFSYAKKGDIVAIIGKGRDNYMAVFDKKLPYSDYDVIMKYLKRI